MTKTSTVKAAPTIERIPLDPTELMKRLYGDAIAEFNDSPSPEDFGIIVHNALIGKSRHYQRAFNLAMARMFCDGEKISTPPKQPKPKADPATEQDRAAKAVERATARLLRSQQEVALVEKKQLIRLSTCCTFHDLWKLGVMLGKKNDRRLVSEHCTKAQLAKVGAVLE